MNLKKGTPKTMLEAIRNGYEEWNNNKDIHPSLFIEEAVRDFMSQKIQLAMLEVSIKKKEPQDILNKLWNNLTRKPE